MMMTVANMFLLCASGGNDLLSRWTDRSVSAVVLATAAPACGQPRRYMMAFDTGPRANALPPPGC